MLKNVVSKGNRVYAYSAMPLHTVPMARKENNLIARAGILKSPYQELLSDFLQVYFKRYGTLSNVWVFRHAFTHT